ncbi:MAG: serine hydrolase domain-containing protein [Sporichthyaceae bacterium]
MPLDSGAIDAVLANAVASGAVPGLAVVVVDRDGILYSGNAGSLRAGGPPVDAETVFRYASMTKALTTVAALQLVEKGRLSLDDEVASVVPEFGKLQVLDASAADDQSALRAPSRQATVRELMNHTAGCSYFFTSADLLRFHSVTNVPHILTGNKASLTEVPLVHDPGTVWEYGVNTDWLGLVVEQASGLELDAYFSTHILDPLGMTGVTFDPSNAQRLQAMPVHARTPEGGLVATPIELPPTPEWWSGGHGLWGTGAAYGRFVQALLRGGELDGTRILSEESVELMFTDSLNGVPMPADGLKSAVPELVNDVPPFPLPETWGLGLHLVQVDVPGARRAWTGDWAGIFNCYYWVDRTTGIGALLLTQVLPFFDEGVVGTLMQVEGTIYAQLGVS